jgi:hypothetical protein
MAKAINLSVAAPGIACQRQVTAHVATKILIEKVCKLPARSEVEEALSTRLANSSSVGCLQSV